MPSDPVERRSTWLDAIERAGNRLPHPITLFVLLAALVLVASVVASHLGLSVTHPRDGSTIRAVNLLNREGVQRCFTEAVRNFVGFAPLGIVLAAMIGVGVAERSGLIAATLHAFVRGVPARWLTTAVVFAGIMSHLAGDAGFLIIPPVAAVLFVSVGRHPLAGIAAAFAGVAGAFSASLLPTMLDVLLADLTRQAAEGSHLLKPNYTIQILGNYYFMAASAVLLTGVGTWVTTRFVEPRLGRWTQPVPSGGDDGPAATVAHDLEPLDPAVERRGLRAALLALGVTLGLMALLVVFPGAPLRAAGGSLLQQIQPFLTSMVVQILLVFLIPGIVFGVSTGRIRNDHDAARMASETMSTMGGYIVLAFFAAQFINYFAWSNLGAMLAIGGAKLLLAMHFHGAPLFIAFIVLIALLNLFISSASAKWAVVAPVFVPMFMQLGYAPEATQLFFRIGASCTNVVTPLLPYLPILLAFGRRYDPTLRPGTFIAMMVPYSLAFLVAWTGLLIVWLMLGLPFGPGVGLNYL